MAQRYDAFRIDRTERTPGSAGLRVPATLTRSGVFEYTDPDGTVVREYRPPEEVAKADSLATYHDAHATIGHPPEGVTPATFERLTVGHISAGTPVVEKSPDGNVKVAGVIFVGRGDAIAGVDSRELVETSMGYGVRIDPTPGTTPQGEKYDRVQRDIVINHVALLRRGDSRLGTTLRLDSKGDQVCACGGPRVDEHLPWDECMARAMKEYGDRAQAEKVCGAIKAANDSKDRQGKTTMKIDGKEVPAEGVVAAIAALEADRDAQRKRADDATTRADGLQARHDAGEAAARRATLDGKAAKAGVETVRKDGDKTVQLTDTEVKVAIIKRADSAFAYDAEKHSDTYLDGRVDSSLAMAAPADRSAPARQVLDGFTSAGTRADAADSPYARAQKAANHAAGAAVVKKGS